MGGQVCFLYPVLYWSLHHLILAGVFFIVPLWSLLESSSLDLPWSLLRLTLSEVSFTRPSAGVFFT